MRVLITGGTGFIGQALSRALIDQGSEVVVLTRDVKAAAQQLPSSVELVDKLSQVSGCDAVVNLAGANLSDKRWSDRFKATLQQSRIDVTQQLLDWVETADKRPHTWINGSAIGYYGSRGDEVLTEQSSAGSEDEFTVRLCVEWEQLAQRATALGVRLCIIRTGIVLGHGGALQKMLTPFKWCLGGAIGSGKQWMSWIHIDDEVAAILHLLHRSELQGAFNLTAPEPVTNNAFSQSLGKALNRPAVLPAPAFAMRLLMGEMADLVLEGQKVMPQALSESGFEFKHPTLAGALRSLLT